MVQESVRVLRELIDYELGQGCSNLASFSDKLVRFESCAHSAAHHMRGAAHVGINRTLAVRSAVLATRNL